MFSNTNPYQLKGMMHMPDRCPVCKADFQRESGFYSAALWTSYPISILIGAICIVLFLFVFHLSAIVSLVLLGVVLLALQPLIMRTGRSILLQQFVKYNPNRNK
ncbi:MAG: DUF983 domain-containing protein [Bacteroidetes bacterium]|nr:DUF983 domain-containing protein [Bacteroidota bacterium]MBK7108586.1 DUF983 domain-containing protein [Bacteroidota bacterium]MBK8680937.1 DUF983 domain-containing protein [Bacteroidota bacterium]MBP9547848.1 DUF983 domain-containing protein [Chitinophagales bacterium]